MGSWAPSLIAFRGRLLARMVELGHEVVTVAADGTAEVRARLAALGVTYHDLPLSRAGLNPLDDARFLVESYRLLRRLSPDLLLAYTIKPVIYGCLAARLAGVPRIHAMITGLGYSFLSPATPGRLAVRRLAHGLYRISLAGCSSVFFQNPDDLDLFRRHGLVRGETPVLVTNGSGVDLEQFDTAPPVTRPLVFLLAGRLLAEKGIREYADAARIVKQRHPEVQCQLLGWFDAGRSGLSPAEVRQWADQGVLDYLGTTNDVRPAIAAASVFVLPSYREGTPRSVLEAMAMGRPIITTDAAGCRETVVDGANGFLVPVGSVSKLATAMARFVEDPSLVQSLGERSRRMAIEKYDVHRVNQVMLHAMGIAA